ncbi:MAG: hypothetical protein R3B72_09945 [Polyangiaceae bacterium]
MNDADIEVDGDGNTILMAVAATDLSIGGATLPGAGTFGSYMFVAKLNPMGGLMWSKTAKVGSVDYIGNGSMTVDGNGGVVVTGYAEISTTFGGPTIASTEPDVFAVRLNSDGSHDWTWRTPAGQAEPHMRRVVAADDGDSYILGEAGFSTLDVCGLTVPAYALFAFRLASGASCTWRKAWASATVRGAQVAAGRLLLTGSFQGSLDFGGGALTAAGRDVFVASLDTATGAEAWSKSFGDGADQAGDDLAVFSNGDILVVGHGAGNIDFGGDVLTGSSEDVFLARLSSTGAHISSSRHGDSAVQDVRGVAVGVGDYWAVVGGSEGLLSFDGASVDTVSALPFVASFHGEGSGLWAQTVAAAVGSPVQVTSGHVYDVAIAANGETVVLTGDRVVRYSP